MASVAGAQDPAPPDSARADSAQRLPTQRIEVTRGRTTLDRVPWAVGAQQADELRRGQPTLGIDEALNNIPGVLVTNRYNYAVDQRLSIRGAGSRANFGLRGVKVLLDGIPQSLPDGQSQLTNIDLAAIGRVEVLRGAASALYGNGSGGVLAFETDLDAPDPLGLTLRSMAGAFGTSKLFARVSGRRGSSVGALSVSRTTLDGFRDHSAADTRQLMAAVDHGLDNGVVLSLRGGSTHTPLSLNPGALQPSEYNNDPTLAAPNNVLRGASKDARQDYLSLRAHRRGERGSWSLAVYGQLRDIENPIPAPPPGVPGNAAADSGVQIGLDRRVTGARLDVERRLDTAWPLRLAGGLDLQQSFDRRRNDRTTGGEIVSPADTLILRQNETTTNVGPFVQWELEPHPRFTLGGGARWDRLTFRAEDLFTGDGTDDSGERSLTATSAQVGAVWRASAVFAPYANVATSFESPTTTELTVRPDGQGGFNPDLGPQRVRSVELGARGAIGARLSYELSVFEAITTDAIVQYQETGARAYFTNAGKLRSRGVELGLGWRAARWLTLRGAYTHADYRFVDYRLVEQNLTIINDGNQLPGVPRDLFRLMWRSTFGNFAVDADQTWQGPLYADDTNLQVSRVDGWGTAGVLNLRGSWRGMLGEYRVEPFVSVMNVWNQRYVSAVTVNGTFNRYLEPGPGRHLFVGVELGAPIIR